jgi:hypothetical protein
MSTPVTAQRAPLARGREHGHAGVAAEVEHPLALKQTREAEVVADAGERVGRLGGQPGEQIVRVAEPLGERTLGWEVEVRDCLVRHVAVHVRDLSVVLLAIHSPDGCVCGVGSHADSVADRPSQELPRRSHSAPVAAAAVARGGSITAAERDCLSKNSETITPRTGNAIAVANAS